jgi:S1-C subfamily serine protease
MSYPQVIRVFSTTQSPDYDCPWQARPLERGTGSGVVIAGHRILTGAHVVANATFVQVQKPADPDKAVARVAAVCHDCDLALLELNDPSFLNGIPPAAIGDLPSLRDKVSVVGFPIGGEEIAITEGVVSRIEVQRYSHSQRYLLAVTVDAAINQGNSGGPVFQDDKIAGIAFQKLSDADNIGELVPAPVIRTFLYGVEQAKPKQIPGLGIMTQPLENLTLRKSTGLESGESGVMVVSVDQGGSCFGVLEPRDVLLEIEGMRISNNGTIQYRERHRTRYDVLLGERHVGDTLGLTIKRRGERISVEITLAPMHYLVPRAQYDVAPTYYIYAGLVFQPLTRDFLATWDKWWDKGPKEFLYHYYSGSRTLDRHQVIVLSQILGDEINMGYEGLYNESVIRVNGVMPRDMHDFVNRLDEARGIVEIETSGPGFIMLDADRARAANPHILARYHVGADRAVALAPTSTSKPHVVREVG